MLEGCVQSRHDLLCEIVEFGLHDGLAKGGVALTETKHDVGDLQVKVASVRWAAVVSRQRILGWVELHALMVVKVRPKHVLKEREAA